MSGCEFIKVTRVQHGDVDIIPLSVHKEYPDLYPAYIEPVVPEPVVPEVVEVVEVVPPTPTKIRKGK